MESRLPRWLQRLEQANGDPEKVKLAVTRAHYEQMRRDAEALAAAGNLSVDARPS